MTDDKSQAFQTYIDDLGAKMDNSLKTINELIVMLDIKDPKNLEFAQKLIQHSSNISTIRAAVGALPGVIQDAMSNISSTVSGTTTSAVDAPVDTPPVSQDTLLLTPDMFSTQSIQNALVQSVLTKPIEPPHTAESVLDKYALTDFIAEIQQHDTPVHFAILKRIVEPLTRALEAQPGTNPYRQLITELFSLEQTQEGVVFENDYLVTFDSAEFTQRPGLYGKRVDAQHNTNTYSTLFLDTGNFLVTLFLAKDDSTDPPSNPSRIFLASKSTTDYLEGKRIDWVDVWGAKDRFGDTINHVVYEILTLAIDPAGIAKTQQALN